MVENETSWWILQVQFPERYKDQPDLLTEPIPRDDLIRQAFSLIPTKIRSIKGAQSWGLADLETVSNQVIACHLNVRPPSARIAEEPEPGFLEETMEPRFFTIALLYIPLQIIAVQRAPEIARYARSAKTFALIFQDLLEKAIQSLEMMHYYSVEVEPIAKYGSFIQWVKGLDELRKIIIHYSGPNLPSSFPELVDSIRETAHGFRDLLKSRNVDMIANDPKLEEKEVAELDAAVAERRINMRAFGIRSGIGTSWSSSEKPESETLRLQLDDDEIEDSRFIANKVIPFLEKLSGGVRNE